MAYAGVSGCLNQRNTLACELIVFRVAIVAETVSPMEFYIIIKLFLNLIDFGDL
jgi:hypothetical protein